MNTSTPGLAALPAPLAAADPADLERLRTSLVRNADAARLIDVAWRSVDSPIGVLLLAATEVGLVRIAFAGEGHDEVLVALSDRISPRVLHAPHRLDAAARELDEYFAGSRRDFDLSLDRRLSHGFRGEVLVRLRAIPYGSTASYAMVARAAGHPGAARAVGTACATNPLPIVIPCHRVVRANGSIGEYGGGVDVKRALLALESAV